MTLKSPRFLVCASLSCSALLSIAREPEPSSGGDPADAKLDEIVVTGKRSDLLGIAPAASEGTASGEELRARPLQSRRGEPEPVRS